MKAMRLTPGWRARAALLLALVGALLACGKKGPPREPFVRLPGAIADLSARRVGSTVFLKFTVPVRNQDSSMPADLKRVEVYAFTGKPENDDELIKYGTLVATLPVRRPPEPEDEDQKARKAGGANEEKKTPKPKEPEPGFDQGATVTVTEALSQKSFEPVVVTRKARQKKVPPVMEPVLLPLPSFSELPARIYLAVGVNHKNRRGAVSPRVAVPLVDPPATPSDIAITYTASAMTLTWTPPPGAPLPPVAPAPAAADPETVSLPGKPIVTLATPVWSYDVFDVTPVKPAEDSKPTSALPPRVDDPAPVNTPPLTAPTFTDSRAFEFGAERCYAVRTLNVFGTMIDESEATAPACVTPKDTFPPAPPKGLIAVATAGSIGLTWEPNTEADLAGYLVLRAEAPGATLTPITAEPIKETTFEDKTVKSGVRYVYAVVAVDKATPPNVSTESNRIEETAR